MDFRTLFQLFFLLCSFITLVRCQENVTVGFGPPIVTPPLTISSGWGYSGGKRDCDGSRLITTDHIGTSISLQFRGTAVYLFATLAWDRGDVNIKLDGKDMGTYAAWVDDRDAWSCSVLFSASSLENTDHRLDASLVSAHNGVKKFELGKFVYTRQGSGGAAGDPIPLPPAAESPAPTTALESNTQSESLPTASDPEDAASSSEPSASTTSTDTPLTNSAPSSQQSASAALTSSPGSNLKTVEVTPNDPRIHYTPADAWHSNNATACGNVMVNSRTASLPGSMLTFTFKGASVSLKTLSTSTSVYTVSLDGQAAHTVDTIPATTSACGGAVIGYTFAGLADVEHVLTVNIVTTSSLLRSRASNEFQFAGFQYSGIDAVDTNTLTSPPAPSTTQTTNVAAIAGGIGGAFAALLLIGVGAFWYHRWLKKRSLAPSAMYAKAMQTGSRNNHNHVGMNSDHSREHQSFHPEHRGGFSPLDHPQAAVEVPLMPRWRPRNFAAINAWTESISRGPNWTAPSPSPSTIPLPLHPSPSDSPTHPTDQLSRPPLPENPPSELLGEKAMLYHVYNR